MKNLSTLIISLLILLVIASLTSCGTRAEKMRDKLIDSRTDIVVREYDGAAHIYDYYKVISVESADSVLLYDSIVKPSENANKIDHHTLVLNEAKVLLPTQLASN